VEGSLPDSAPDLEDEFVDDERAPCAHYEAAAFTLLLAGTAS
jgi:hypothetical protein